MRVQLVCGEIDRVDRNQERTTWVQPDAEAEGVIDLTGVDPSSQEFTLAMMRSRGFRGKVCTGPQRVDKDDQDTARRHAQEPLALVLRALLKRNVEATVGEGSRVSRLQ